MDEDLLLLAANADERDFAVRALTFLTAHTARRSAPDTAWGTGPENLALFHETSDEQERAQARAARSWQRLRWDAGFGWITGPTEHGGAGHAAGHDRLYRLLEAAFDVPDMSPLRLGLGTVAPAITRFGSPEQIAAYATPIYRGDLIACQLFSEPAAGSDLASVRTRAQRQCDSWIINGQKVWTSNATFADIGLALVRTEFDGQRHRDLSMFVVPMAADGVVVRPLRQMTGGASFTEVFLTDVEVADTARIGEVGGGWSVATGALAAERRAAGDRSHEMTSRAVTLLVTLARRTGQFDDAVIRDAWATLYCRLRIARLVQQRLEQLPDDALTGAGRAMDKVLLSTNLRLIGELAAELLGPEFIADTGGWGTYGWNRWLMGALGYRIAGGTEEILKTMLAERVLGLPRPATSP